ncbi:hypothetical protein [Halodesulfovibrio sp.]|uniref:hypothetical protein n=1 Tax=Halodesulfovibrio sp. TaxID=1912772 RepID=UPI0025BEB8CB|nr:hypothetical protein [Halodesulfovibrio sp.]
MKKRIITVCMIALLALPNCGYAYTSQHSYRSFYRAVGSKFGSLNKYFRNNFLFDVRYSPDLVARLKSWLENDEQLHFEIDRFLVDRQFVHALQNIAGEYAKKEWRFRHNKRIKDINGIKYSSTQHEQVPFGETDKYYTRRFNTHWPNARPNGRYPGKSFYWMFLLAGDEFPTNAPYYPIHQAGTGSVGITSTALVLSVTVDFYSIDKGLRSEERANSTRPFYWLVLPSWKKISRQPNEATAAQYVKDRLKIWLPI